jgi:PEP-CTERM motif-containing protein
MLRTLCAVTALVFGLVCNTSATTIVLQDSSLLELSDVGGTADSTLDAVTDIAGDPGVQYDITWANKSGYADIAIGKYNPTEIGIGDTWELTIKNLDPTYQTYARLYMQVDGWAYNQGDGAWIAAGGMETISIVNPAATVVNALGVKVGTDSWTNRPDGSSVSVQVVVPEPSTIAMLALGGLLLWRKRR